MRVLYCFCFYVFLYGFILGDGKIDQRQSIFFGIAGIAWQVDGG